MNSDHKPLKVSTPAPAKPAPVTPDVYIRLVVKVGKGKPVTTTFIKAANINSAINIAHILALDSYNTDLYDIDVISMSVTGNAVYSLAQILAGES